MSECKKSVLGYWGIRGLAQPIRLLLNYVAEDFEDKLYEIGGAPGYISESWRKDKLNLGLVFPNLPYYIDGNVKITQSNAILRYIARKHNLCGENETERVNVDIMENQAMDFRNGAVRLFYNSADYETNKVKYLEELPKKLQQFEDFLGEKQYFAGDKITFVDFPMYELLDQHRVLDSTCLDSCPKLKGFLNRFENVPSIKAYMESDKFMKTPINNKMAAFGNK